MTLEIAYLLVLMLVAFVLFATEIVSIDIVGLLLLSGLLLPGILSPAAALAGLGSETIFILIGLFVLTAGIRENGVIERLGLRLAAFGADRPRTLSRVLIATATVMSAFISNTITTAVLLPIAVGSAKRAGISIARMLMPLAFASILAGSITVNATSTNLVISGELPGYGLERIGFFELAPVGLGLTLAGLAYLLLIAPRLVPDRLRDDRIHTFGLRSYISEADIPKGSKLAGQTLAESKLGETLNLTVLSIRRGDKRYLQPRADSKLHEGDILLIEGSAEDILAIRDVMGVDIDTGFEATDADLEDDEVRIVEAMLMPESRWLRKSARGNGFRQATGLTVLAIHSPGARQDFQREMSRRRMGVGDVLLLQGERRDLDRLDPNDLLNLEDVSAHHPAHPRDLWPQPSSWELCCWQQPEPCRCRPRFWGEWSPWF